MKMFIPSIGDSIELTRGWEFPVYFENRNSKLIQRLKPNFQPGSWWSPEVQSQSALCFLEKGTILKVARIYIRQGKSEWDSITFTIVSAPKDGKRAAKKVLSRTDFDNGVRLPEKVQKLKGARFWAKLVDVNEMNCKKVEE